MPIDPIMHIVALNTGDGSPDTAPCTITDPSDPPNPTNRIPLDAAETARIRVLPLRDERAVGRGEAAANVPRS